MKRILLLTIFSAILVTKLFATGEPATQFNIFIPPNNDNTRRDVCLIITAIYDSTSFNIQDDGMDGDIDDSKTGLLMAGQSYILYIRDNGVNDDAPAASNGTQKQDGDYFNITANKIILASQSTDSDWQHDWVPSISGTGIGTKFLIYAPKISSSQRDVNVMAYSDSTVVTIRKISITPTTLTGYTNVDMYSNVVVAQKLINKGQDLIYYNANGRDLLTSGHSYIIETNKPVTVQYGALWGNERDGGGYVPSSNGSGTGELFYFAVPYQSTTEQEIRIVSWDDNNNVVLERFLNGAWVNVKNFTGLNAKKTGEWIGKTNGQTYASLFRITCTTGKRVSVFEANWLETGSVGTSDIATMATASNGKASGKEFLVYMSPPGYEQNCTDPFTAKKLSQNTHAYIFANVGENSTVTVKDVFTNGLKFNKTFNIQAGKYVDCNLTLADWKNIYNGTGTTAGAERPYLYIESSQEVSVMITNFNDNWMMYFGSSQVKSLNQTGSTIKSSLIPGASTVITNNISTESTVNNATIEVVVGSGLTATSSTLTNLSTNQSTQGTITTEADFSTISFTPIPVINPSDAYVVNTTVTASLLYNNGTTVSNNTVVNVETVVSGTANGQFQQSVSSVGITDLAANTSNFLYSKSVLTGITTDLTTSWTSNWVDFDGDGDDDLFVSELDKAKQNIMYINNGNGSFTKSSSGIFASSTDRAATITSSWADIDNDGDLDFIVANNGKPANFLYKNDSKGNFSRISNDPTVTTEGYHHSVSFADYDNDGFVDLYMSDYMPTKYNRLFHNNGNGTFTEIFNTPITTEAAYSLIGAWCDYDSDGDPDLFVCNDKGTNNILYRNEGKGVFAKLENSIVSNDQGYSVSATWVDYDNDLDMDLFVENSNSDAFLYKNNGNGTFSKVTNSIITQTGNGSLHGGNWMDFDNDGDLDLYIVSNNKGKVLFLNDGTGNFTRKTTEVINASLGSTYSSACADFDKDGDIDIFVPSLNKEANYLFIHNPISNKYFEAKLKGTISNGSAVGAKIYVKANINGKNIWQMREVNAQSGFGGQNSYTQHFGLQTASIIDSITIKWPSGIIQNFTNVNVNQILNYTEPNGCNITGIAYNDLNGNCQKDVNEEILPNRKIKIMPGNINTTTNISGSYSVYLPIGSYTIAAVNDNYWTSVCASLNQTVTTNMINTTVSNKNIGFKALGQTADNYVDINSTSLRRGFRNTIKLQYGNTGNVSTQNDTLHIIVPNEVVVLQTSTPWSAKNGNEYLWYIPSSDKAMISSLNITDSVSRTAELGAFVTLTSFMSNSSLESNFVNNIDTLNMKIMGSFDPNDLAVSPQGDGIDGYVFKSQTLTYTVRFENAGNYKADFVIITDELPEGLDISSLTISGASHPYTMAIYNNKLEVTMASIDLPSKSEDSIACHGYVSFKVKMLSNIPSGMILENKAAIYFDYNDPIVTNSTTNTVKLIPVGYEMFLAPNPASDFVTIGLLKNDYQFEKANFIIDIQIQDLTGRNISSFNNVNESTKTIDVSNLISGIYLIKVSDTSGRTYTQKLQRK